MANVAAVQARLEAGLDTSKALPSFFLFRSP